MMANISATVAHPTELIKCKLQLQMIQPDNVPKQFSGPFDVVRQTVQAQGFTGMWKGLGSSFIYRSCMGAMFGSELTVHFFIRATCGVSDSLYLRSDHAYSDLDDVSGLSVSDR
jgi:hypothetical protein